MKRLISGFVIILLVTCVASCRKTSFIESKDALLTTSADTLHFDTVFTTTGSVTKVFKIFNINDQKLRLSNIKLIGGNASAFKLNVDGTPGANFSNIEIAANDSIYVFVSVTVNPTAANLPFIVQDSILINYNGNNRYVQLDAFGRNALFYRNRRISLNETWTNTLPIVILGGISVDNNVTITIQKGAKVFCHADAPVIINGSLKVNGEKFDSTRVTFAGDRLDQDYRDFPGSWPGIFFSATSKDNVLNYAIIKNAYQGIITTSPSLNANPKITLNQCIINNIYDAGIISSASNISATNCLISNCGTNIAIVSGGTYNFNHCTVVSYDNLFLAHKNPVLFISNANDLNQPMDLNATFRNSIFYGVGLTENEIVVDKKGATPFNLVFDNVLYKVKDNPVAGTFTNSIKNQTPQFDSIDAGRRYFDFHLKPGSPAVDKVISITTPVDLDGKPRGVSGAADIGCYER